MYWSFLKYMIIYDIRSTIKGRKREIDLTIPRIIAAEEKQNVLGIYIKMLRSLIATGCTFKEYYNLGFQKRSLANQKTFITTGSNLIAYRRVNDASYNHVYINKDEFNTIYGQFIGRDWLRLSESKERVYEFFRKHNDVIVKPCDGDSGKGIFIVHDCLALQLSEIDRIISENTDCIIEEMLHNHPEINVLNASSLNTMRIITVRIGNKLDILFAGIRFGAKGSEIDNISQGGFVAPIDIKTGKISGASYKKKNIESSPYETQNYIGFQIPMWDDLYDYLFQLTATIPQMQYMAWDIAITSSGFVTIEGNHSSGNTISQVHFDTGEEGLKPKLDSLIESTC